ncbi:MAG TPA: NAD(P)/FAD-dependent oxidoreductase [Candidatus Syntrophoarchaeum butanivorans]|uniref:Digeranylgeranylglycerophospholipid reductase n=1 Tax=Candidatus Syntropharchaeum butanivorans TaxID=1839936 RepID=A0A1F2P4S2_9EURY|nr:MAG: geranylgeranyl reductase family protein [Candidatus Syntrophoarchaeum butanivorans]HEC56268.1 NAD(P)/FAD-dependent oxidoreductase [Candidatus Syntrophoarchaeum butanivorans]
MEFKTRYDIIVVGAGPGGSMAAKTAAELGLDVLMVEKRQEIGTPVRCAEGVGKEGLTRYISPDKRWISCEVEGARIYAPDGSYLTMKKTGKSGYVLERKVFDRVLAQEAVRAGASVVVKCRASGLIFDDGRVAGVELVHFGEKFCVKSDLVIAADGIESKVGRWAGIDTSLRLDDIESCAQYLMSGLELDGLFTEFYLGNDLAPGGYAWVFPKGDRMANVGIGINAARMRGLRPIDYLNRFVRSKFPYGKILEVVVGGVAVCGPIERTVTDGLMLVGDAARQSDPLTGGGIINAMEAGTIAGEVAARAIEHGDTSAAGLEAYEKRWREGIGKKIGKMLRAKNVFFGLSDRELNAISASLQGEDIDSFSGVDLVMRVVKRNPLLLKDLIGVL